MFAAQTPNVGNRDSLPTMIDALNAADWVVIVVVGLSMLLSLWRGFTREALSLVSWLLALFGARLLAPALAEVFAGYIADPTVREWLAFAVLFLFILMAGMLLAYLIGEAMHDSPLNLTDRVLGMAFGFVRGVLVVVVAIAFSAQWLANETWWTSSQIIPRLALLEGWTRETAHALGVWIAG